jgi:A/G-specific adenine glycosylase
MEKTKVQSPKQIKTLKSKIIWIRRGLLRWYDQNRRDLPWRRTRDPYAIWIAETMLQQTQVKTVLPYYRRFLKAFPTLETLDRAPKEKVLALWSGLGYYRRAENLKNAARTILRRHRGKIPQEFDSLRALPGVGPYTAGALMSIAFDQAYPALDGNARRVLTRIFNVNTERELREIGKRLVPPSRPGHFNQALMELGSTICLARDPNCPICPFAQSCAARRSGRFQLKQPSSAKRKIKKVEWPLAVIQNGRKILLRRRPPGGILGGLWEVPLVRHLSGLGEQVKPSSFIGEIRHNITCFRIRAPLFVFTCSNHKKIRLPHSRWRWFSLSSLSGHPLSSLSLKAIRLLTTNRPAAQEKKDEKTLG